MPKDYYAPQSLFTVGRRACLDPASRGRPSYRWPLLSHITPQRQPAPECSYVYSSSVSVSSQPIQASVTLTPYLRSARFDGIDCLPSKRFALDHNAHHCAVGGATLIDHGFPDFLLLLDVVAGVRVAAVDYNRRNQTRVAHLL